MKSRLSRDFVVDKLGIGLIETKLVFQTTFLLKRLVYSLKTTYGYKILAFSFNMALIWIGIDIFFKKC